MKVINTPNQNPISNSERDKRVSEPGFGKYYTDNMVVAQWSEATGWQDAELKAYGPLTLDPATMVFHYGQEVFEGMKAYSQPDGGISLFRPEANAKRFAKSAARIALPEMPVDFFVKTVEELVKQEKDWVPKKIGESCDQVAYIDAVERKWVEEMGGMNLYFIKGSGKDATIMTPKLTGTLLPGITRDSILTLAKDLGYKTEESMISIDQWRDGVKSGEITEIFACGTAAVISAVGAAKSAQGTWQTGDGKPGVITNELRAALLAIQHGTAADKHGWNKRVV